MTKTVRQYNRSGKPFTADEKAFDAMTQSERAVAIDVIRGILHGGASREHAENTLELCSGAIRHAVAVELERRGKG